MTAVHPRHDRSPESSPDCQPLKILHLFRALHSTSGGPLSFYEAVLSNLDSMRFVIEFAAVLPCTPPDSAKGCLRTGDVNSASWKNIIAFLFWLREKLATVDVVHIHGVFSWQFIVGALLCQMQGVPYLIRPHGSLSEQFLATRARLKAIYLRLFGLRVLRRAFAITAMTPCEAKFMQRLDARLPVQIVMPSVEIPDIALNLRQPSETLRVVFLGRVAQVKCLPDLLCALGKLRESGLKASLDVVGDGQQEYVGLMKRLAQEEGIGSNVIFHGFLQGEAKRKVMARAHVMALTSRGENFSFATAEALAMGLPVVITDKVGLAPFVKNAGAGRVISVNDIDALAQALAEYRDPLVRQRASERARTWATENLGAEKMGRRLSSLYEEAGTHSKARGNLKK